MATLATCPNCQLFGIFGHAGSTLNFGTSRAAGGRVCRACAAAVSTAGRPAPARRAASADRTTLGPMVSFMAAILFLADISTAFLADISTARCLYRALDPRETASG